MIYTFFVFFGRGEGEGDNSVRWGYESRLLRRRYGVCMLVGVLYSIYMILAFAIPR